MNAGGRQTDAIPAANVRFILALPGIAILKLVFGRMPKPMPVVATLAFCSFLRSHDHLTAFCLMTLNPTFSPWSAVQTEDVAVRSTEERQTLLAMKNIAETGKTIAGNLAIVYLISIMEAYVKDAAYELLNKKIAEVTSN